jgi:hypothetical protein
MLSLQDKYTFIYVFKIVVWFSVGSVIVVNIASGFLKHNILRYRLTFSTIMLLIR